MSGPILIVDDDKTTRAQVEKMFAELGHECDTAVDGSDGIERFRMGNYELVLSAVEMSGLEGVEMCRHIREIDPTAVIVLMTALEDQDTAVRALKVGAQDFLRKPFSIEQLAEAIDGRLVRKQQRRRQQQLGTVMKRRDELQQLVSDQRRSLQQTEDYVKLMLDAAPYAIISTDSSGNVLTVNGVAEKLYGVAAADALGPAGSPSHHKI